MSIQNLFTRNDFNLFANSVTTTNGSVIGGNVAITGNLTVGGTENIANTSTLSNIILNGYLEDNLSNKGSAGQYLGSTGTAVQWVNLPSSLKQIFFNSNGNIGTGWIGYEGFGGTMANFTYLIATPTTMTNLTITFNAAPTGTGSWIFGIIKNGSVLTSLTFSIAVGATTGTINAIVPFVAGDTFALQCQSSQSPSTPSATYATIVYQ